jgi:hypothetical protein
MGEMISATFVKERVFNASIMKEERGGRRVDSPVFRDDGVFLCAFFPGGFIGLQTLNAGV